MVIPSPNTTRSPASRTRVFRILSLSLERNCVSLRTPAQSRTGRRSFGSFKVNPLPGALPGPVTHEFMTPILSVITEQAYPSPHSRDKHRDIPEHVPAFTFAFIVTAGERMVPC